MNIKIISKPITRSEAITSPQRTTHFLIANLGAEMIRFFSLQKRKDTENAKLSAARALHIIDQIMQQKDIGNGKEEISMLKKIIEDSLLNSHIYNISESDLNSYFMPFASRVL